MAKKKTVRTSRTPRFEFTRTAPKRLYRSRNERMLGGVCGGIAEYLDADPTIVRLIWALLTIFSMGMGLLAYLIAWLIIPERR